ncbi:MAG: methylated-DNA--[protein]-cysteine S-methyltransferase [Puniceicoccaceae bacterium]|nr:MAG: methylated-DNA--[protein]-cysteine S-methyltransferase [Puniceicoccaceae bacterium]
MPPTEFQKKVWAELKKIPRGETRTYTDIAESIGHPKAARAVANACGKNPRPIKIPCHRVIASDGSIGGYSAEGGVLKKAELLRAEGVDLAAVRKRRRDQRKKE